MGSFLAVFFKSMKLILALIIICGTFSARADEVECKREMDQHSVAVKFVTPQGERHYLLESAKLGIEPLMEFIWPFFRTFDRKDRQVLSVVIKGKTRSFDSLSDIKMIKGETNLVFLDRGGLTNLVAMNDIDEINFPYDETGKLDSILGAVAKDVSNEKPVKK
jgi:hypothetical protein